MPELPEVETTKEGIKPHLEGQIITQVIVRNAKLRQPVSEQLPHSCYGQKIRAVTRRAKYIIISLSQGYLLIHLGMSGHLRVLPASAPAQKHDHIDILLSNDKLLRYCDPRRFGLVLYFNDAPEAQPMLSHLGPEPLTEAFHQDYLQQKIKNKKQPIKSLIMDNHVVVGVGNIYAAESLFLAKIHPLSAAQALTASHCERLTQAIKSTLAQAIEAGGTTLKDFYGFDGQPGYFKLSLQVYGRKQQPCFSCASLIETVVISGRHSAYCPQCQPLLSNRRLA